jgi:hypothetical protein
MAIARLLRPLRPHSSPLPGAPGVSLGGMDVHDADLDPTEAERIETAFRTPKVRWDEQAPLQFEQHARELLADL